MPKQPSLNLGDIEVDKDNLEEFRDSIQIVFDEIFLVAHDEPNSNPIIATKTGKQSIPVATETKVLFNLVREGDVGEFNTSQGRYVPNLIGNYWISSTVELPGLGTDTAFLVIKKNNVEVWKGSESTISASITAMVNIEDGDFIEIYITHTHASPQDTTGTQSRIKFAGYKIP